ncbi:MAG: SGNH/GDSL hydrolase family protein [Planctomycetaceae bacterium]|nr:SGNH/GDSL hydrolase family protein [Planctomycetales bacterium]MCB9925231.1 SGNH/GDSL hydrolase family protein [Planctomycetaceae bacterium]
MIMKALITISLLLSAINLHAADFDSLLAPGNRILFLGDSITHAGHYISRIETQVRTMHPTAVPIMINLGLPSETCSGLSEPDHPFPRPDVHERIDRALAKVKPDVVFACYGMNDGIYYPFSEDRFAAYRKGINDIISKVRASGAKLVLMTPPAFDALPLKKKGDLRPVGADKYAWFAIYEGYDEVLEKYSEWLMTLEGQVDHVVDLHTPVNDYVAAKRKAAPEFTMSPDGVHVNEQGHQVLAAAILKSLDVEPQELAPDLLQLVSKRQQILHASWVSHVGHKRPGVAAGLSLEDANAKAAEIDQLIAALK